MSHTAVCCWYSNWCSTLHSKGIKPICFWKQIVWIQFHGTFRFLCGYGPMRFENRFVWCCSMECAPQSISDRCLTCVATDHHSTAINPPTPDCCLPLYIQLLLTLKITLLTSTDMPPLWFLQKSSTTTSHVSIIGQTIIRRKSELQTTEFERHQRCHCTSFPHCEE